MANAKGQERTDELVSALREWQAIERKAIDNCAEIMEKTDNALIRQFMEIIRNDSVQHHRVQQFLIDSLTKEQVRLTPEELGEVWDEITAHDEVERETIEMAKRTFGVGIVSTGWVAGAHAANFKQVPDCQIVAVSSRKKSRAEEFIQAQQLPTAEAYGSFESMLANDRLDIVVIASPHTLHPSQTIAAARAGKHVVNEKPVAINARDLSAMVREVNKAGLLA